MNELDLGFLGIIAAGLFAAYFSRGLAELNAYFSGGLRGYLSVRVLRLMWLGGGILMAAFGAIGFLRPLWLLGAPPERFPTMVPYEPPSFDTATVASAVFRIDGEDGPATGRGGAAVLIRRDGLAMTAYHNVGECVVKLRQEEATRHRRVVGDLRQELTMSERQGSPCAGSGANERHRGER